jgi:penicillin-binding protein 1B
VIAVMMIALAVAMLPFWRLSGQFFEQQARQPSRLYGSSTLLVDGGLVDLDAVVAELALAGYHPRDRGELPPGRFRRAAGRFEVHLRPHWSPLGLQPRGRVVAELAGQRVTALTLEGRPAETVMLPAPLLATYYDDDREERRPVRLDELPEEVIHAVLAAEDDGFFHHSGLSLAGITRALWVNLRGGEVRQGGSTLTQQLVKNLYLTHERTVSRKLREAILAILVELRYSKRQILEAYLNEIYLGAAEGVNLIGLGSASQAFFGKSPAELTVVEAATVAGMIRAPALYSPVDHPEAARERRDWVLDRMARQGWLSAERVEEARRRPISVTRGMPAEDSAPYFAQRVAEEAVARFAIDPRREKGYRLYSTLRLLDQRAAGAAVAWGLEALEKGWQKGTQVQGPLQAALVSIDPVSGGILAYVGGRDYRQSQFDRAGVARRQAGSAFKPVVYAAAFEQGTTEPAGFVEDGPLTVRLAGRTWSPQNSDGEYQGWVTARTALERSLNTATARLALETGLGIVVDTAHRMGVGGPLEEVPALALGAFEVSPLELATVYGTLANAGVRPAVHGLAAVLDADGRPVAGKPPRSPERVLSPQVAYMVTAILEGVLDRGTGVGARRQGLPDILAGKTGTSNGRRDSWFAGYAPSRSTVVWVGYDDNSPTRLSGARAGVPIWARFMGAVRPPGGYPAFRQPPGLTTAVIDPESGALATDLCPQVITEVFWEGRTPGAICPLHRDPYQEAYWSEPYGGERYNDPPRRHRFRRWLRRVFGDERYDGP